MFHASARSSRRRLVLIGGAAMGCIGCAPMTYHLSTGMTLVPPQVSRSGTDTYRIKLPGTHPAAGCSFDTGGLAVKTADGAVLLSVHAAEGADKRFAENLAELEAHTPECFDRLLPNPLLRVLQGAPMPAQELSTIVQGDAKGDGYIPLLPGEILRVTTPLSDDSGKWQGMTTLWYGLAPRPDGSMEVLPPSETAIHGSLTDTEAARLEAHALELPPHPVARYWRMLLNGHSATALTNTLIGAADIAALDDTTRRVMAGGAEACAEVKPPAWCIAPHFGTVIGAELQVGVQGQAISLPLGATVLDAVRQVQPGAVAAGRLPAGFSVLRPYGDKLIPVAMAPGSNDILNLVLLGGETITWGPKRT